MIATRGIVASSLVAAAIGGPSLALADDTFQAEAALSYSRFKTDFSRQNTAGAEATYFFDKLPTQSKDYPLEQAQFVERIGSLSANYSRTDNNFDNFESLNKGWMYGVTALSLGWARNTTQNKSTSGGAPLSDSKDISSSISISGEHLARLSGGDHLALLAGLSLDTQERQGSASEKNRTVFVKATYYPTKMLGLTLGALVDRGDDRFNEGEFYLAGVKMFVTPTLSLSLDFQKSHAKAPNAPDFDMVALKALARF